MSKSEYKIRYCVITTTSIIVYTYFQLCYRLIGRSTHDKNFVNVGKMGKMLKHIFMKKHLKNVYKRLLKQSVFGVMAL